VTSPVSQLLYVFQSASLHELNPDIQADLIRESLDCPRQSAPGVTNERCSTLTR